MIVISQCRWKWHYKDGWPSSIVGKHSAIYVLNYNDICIYVLNYNDKLRYS